MTEPAEGGKADGETEIGYMYMFEAGRRRFVLSVTLGVGGSLWLS